MHTTVMLPTLAILDSWQGARLSVGPPYTRRMTMTAAEVLNAAKALPRGEREEVVEGLIVTLGEHGVPEQARLTALREAVQAGIADLDAGRYDDVAADDLREYIRRIGEEAVALGDAAPE